MAATAYPRKLLRSDSGCSTSQNVFLNLSGRGLGQFLDESDAMRRFEVSEVGPRKLTQLALIGAGAWLGPFQVCQRTLLPLSWLRLSDESGLSIIVR